MVSQSLMINQNSGSLFSGSQVLVSNLTNSYSSIFYNYMVSSGSNARAGMIMAVWSGSIIQYTDTSTNDIGSTLNVFLTASLSSSYVQLSTVLPTNGWLIKTLANLL